MYFNLLSVILGLLFLLQTAQSLVCNTCEYSHLRYVSDDSALVDYFDNQLYGDSSCEDGGTPQTCYLGEDSCLKLYAYSYAYIDGPVVDNDKMYLTQVVKGCAFRTTLALADDTCAHESIDYSEIESDLLATTGHTFVLETDAIYCVCSTDECNLASKDVASVLMVFLMAVISIYNML